MMILKVLFICTNNLCTSVIATSVFNNLAEKRSIDAVSDSAGIGASAGERADPFAIEVMKEIDIDISSHLSKNITPQMLKDYDFLFVMSMAQKDKLIAFDETIIPKIKVMEINDPYGKGIEQYRVCRNEIVSYIDQLLNQ